jgi:hypothetical protein
LQKPTEGENVQKIWIDCKREEELTMFGRGRADFCGRSSRSGRSGRSFIKGKVRARARARARVRVSRLLKKVYVGGKAG